MGLHNFNNNNYKASFDFFVQGINTEIANCCYYNYYNLATLFFENGCKDLDIQPNLSLAISYYEIASNYNNYESMLKLCSYYYKKYKEENSEFYNTKFKLIKNKIESHTKFNAKDKRLIENTLNDIKLTIDIT